MGPSGSGKTTLLNGLAHRKNSKYKLTGDVFVNGVKPSELAFRKLSSYVEQEGTSYSFYSSQIILHADMSNR